jgi:hypothetical protein
MRMDLELKRFDIFGAHVNSVPDRATIGIVISLIVAGSVQ